MRRLVRDHPPPEDGANDETAGQAPGVTFDLAAFWARGERMLRLCAHRKSCRNLGI